MAMTSTLTAFAVLEKIAARQPVGLSDLARAMGLPKSTVQRCVETLRQAGWIEMESPETKRWVIGIRPLSIAVTAIERGGLHDRALAVMNLLSADTDETIHLAVRDGREVVLVERVDSPHALRAVAPVGLRAPMHASSNGKALLAALPEAALLAYVKGDLPPVTGATMTDPRHLLEEIRTTRAAGYAVSRGELQDGVVSVAAAIRNRAGHPVASLSISAPRDRMPADRVSELGPKVHAAASDIVAQLGV